ncbi:MAG TPA: hypothetical protein VEG44_10910 [Candidatus Acidoferrales bacterium]|nr:hypothetical protein [Candidatus Acidoferrales bacterium]
MKKNRDRFTYLNEYDFLDEDNWTDADVVTTYKKRNKRNKYSIK